MDDSSMHADESYSDEHSGDSPENKSAESSPQRRSEHETDIWTEIEITLTSPPPVLPAHSPPIPAVESAEDDDKNIGTESDWFGLLSRVVCSWEEEEEEEEKRKQFWW